METVHSTQTKTIKNGMVITKTVYKKYGGLRNDSFYTKWYAEYKGVSSSGWTRKGAIERLSWRLRVLGVACGVVK